MPGATPSYPPENSNEKLFAWCTLLAEQERRLEKAKELGVSDNSLRSWVKQTERSTPESVKG